MTTHARRSLLTLAFALAAASSLHAADRTSALIGEQLDKLVKLQLENTPLPQVLATIEKQTGVPVRVSDDVYATLPWGTHTPITATVEGLSLRDALAAISGKLGLRFDLRDEAVELSPQPSLRRLGRRATLQELRTLDVLSARKLGGTGGAPTVAALTRAIDASLAALDAELEAKKQPPARLVLETRPAEGADLDKTTVLVPRDATLAGALDALAGQTKLTWYPWGDGVVVLPKRDIVAARLDRPVTVGYDGTDIAQVLVDLAAQSGVEFSIEPGAIQRVPPEYRIVRLSVDAASVRQALEALQGYTGLGYVVTDGGVYVWNQNSNPAAANRGRVIATVTVEGGANVLIYEDQLSAAAREQLKAQQQRAAERLEAELSKSEATTRPATARDN